MSNSISVKLTSCDKGIKYKGSVDLDLMRLDIDDIHKNTGKFNEIIFRFPCEVDPEKVTYKVELKFNPDEFSEMYKSKLKHLILENKKLKKQMKIKANQE